MTGSPVADLVALFATSGVLAAEQEVLDDAFDELADRLARRGFETISYDVAGLAERIRAGKNGTPVPNPHKPLPTRPQPRPQPKPQDPPKPPPSKPGGR